MDRPDTRAIWDANAPAWIELSRAGYDVCRDLVNTPAFLELLPPLDGARCLDLGCGEGHNSRLLEERGAEVVGLDISEVFVRAAADVVTPAARFLVGDGASLPVRARSVDVVTAFMSLMDVADPEATVAETARVLRPGGVLQFSVLHPVNGTPRHRWIEDDAGRRSALVVGDYFDEGPVSETWTFGTAPPEVLARTRPFEITYARRTLSGWVGAVLEAGFEVTAIAEPCADEETATLHPEVADSRIAPYFLILQGRRR